MNQEQLFDVTPRVQAPATDTPPQPHEPLGHTDRLSQMADNKKARRLSTLADRLQGESDPIKRARLASEARDLAEALVEQTILDANRAGITWRDLGAGLGVPFQTLYRRYGANR
jgi:hypothetical protein